jgi:hypothetical protein
MRRYFVAAVAAALFSLSPLAAKAELIQFVNPNNVGCVTAEHCGQFVDIGALGFGNAPRLLTLQDSPGQFGSVTPSATGPVVHDGAIDGANKANTPTVGSLGWLGGSGVAIGYNLNQNSGGGPLLSQLNLSIYDTAFALIHTFTLASPTTYTDADFHLQPGNGNGIFGFVLDNPERLLYTSLVINGTINGSSLVGLGAVMGCDDKQAICASNDGADTFLALSVGTPIINPTCPDCVPNPTAVPLPVAGAGIPGLVVACLTLFGLHRRRRNRLA